MKKLFILLSLIIIVNIGACTREVQNTGIIGALHRVEYGANVAYLFGTMHSGREGWFPLADIVEDALYRSDVVVIEVSEYAMGVSGAIILEQVHRDVMYLPDSLTWEEYLPEDAYNHLIDVLDAWKITYSYTTNPAVFIDFLENELRMNLSDLSGAYYEDTVDGYIVNKAFELDLPVIGLESAEHFANIFFNLPYEVLVSRIMHFSSPEEYIKATEESTSLDDIANNYENNDFDSIIKNFAHDMIDSDESPYLTYFKDVMMNGRSVYYAKEILRLLSETESPTTFFVAVGFSHITRSGAGEGFTDIVQQLELAGLSVEPMW